MSLNAVNHRRVLHRMPELDDELPDTTAYVRKVLEPLGAEVFSPIKGSVCAYFDAGAEETVALRADMDALPADRVHGAFLRLREAGAHACLRARRPHGHRTRPCRGDGPHDQGGREAPE